MSKTFEESLDQLEAIVRKLEDGDLPLEESLELFEKGVKLSRECKERLVRAERRIEVLMKESNGELKLKDFDEEE
jgi:exodeoxyribonuclease VII small subunit